LVPYFAPYFFGVSQAGLEINRDGASYFNYIFAQTLTQLVFTLKQLFLGKKGFSGLFYFAFFVYF